MGGSQSTQKINFEDMQTVVKQSESHLLINTLETTEQSCLIYSTIPCEQEENIINKYVKRDPHVKIIVYGKHCNDEKIYTKYNQLISLGFMNVYIYVGGLFEWMLLQEIYGKELFQTTSTVGVRDLLKHKPPQKLNVGLIEY